MFARSIGRRKSTRRSAQNLRSRPKRVCNRARDNGRRSFHVSCQRFIDSKSTVITRATDLKPVPDLKTLVFGKEFTDHLLEIDWDKSTGWAAPQIRPFDDFRIHPAASCLHYALECFEGTKAYKDAQGRTRLFRPDMNMKRMNSSLARLNMQTFDEQEHIECLKQLIRVEERWVPQEKGYSLYIRPTAIGTNGSLGVGPASAMKLFTILSPVGPYYPEGFKPVKLYANPRNVRAWPGGVGNIKCGGNYAMSVHAQMEAAEKGYAQVMWLFDDEVTEVGTMNQFFFWINEAGEKELITAPLDGTILPGVTRDSILHLCRDWDEFKVTERAYTLTEVIKALNENRLLEAFGAGTAAIISPVNGFGYKGTDYDIPCGSDGAGELAARLLGHLQGIQYGEIPHEWSVILD